MTVHDLSQGIRLPPAGRHTRVWASTRLILSGLAMDGMTSRAFVTRPYDTSTPELMVTTLKPCMIVTQPSCRWGIFKAGERK